ncbi:MAG: hypothetical protein Q8881_02320 [Sweet potato little leaf phytoplasma]|nr:hypothetical protein [Sweet potato little leaf phytoplasma]
MAGVDGFIGASVAHQTQNPFCSKVVKDLSFFVSWSKEIPFARAVLKRSGNEFKVKAELASGRRGMHVPEWLPGFPEANGEENGSGVGESARWERSSSVVECLGDGVKSRDFCGGDLRKERGIVRFRIGVQRRTGFRLGGLK